MQSHSTSLAQLVYIVASDKTADLLMKGQLAHLSSQGYEITIIASPGPHLREVARREGVKVVPITIARNIRPFRDLLTLFQIWRYLRRAKPQIVNASTPKAGLLGMISAYMCRVPVRIYTLRGLRLETTGGIQRLILGVCERISSKFAHRVVCVSKSLAKEYIDGKFAPPEKITVLGEGSSNGVDIDRFSPTPSRYNKSATLRHELGIAEDALLLGFVGRMTRDKGIAELVEVFEQLSLHFPTTHLILIGEYESGNAVDLATRARIHCNPNIHVTGFVVDTAQYYRILDLLLFPSHREGFPNAVIEAQATGLPVVGYAATGTVDAVLEGETGQLAAVGDTDRLREAVAAYLIDPDLRRRHGVAARKWAINFFESERIWKLLDNMYRQELTMRQTDESVQPSHSSPIAAG